jgi:hypothetical protein
MSQGRILNHLNLGIETINVYMDYRPLVIANGAEIQ